MRRPHPLIAELVQARKRQGLSAHAAARLAEISPETVIDLENAVRSPNTTTLIRLAQALGYAVTLTPVPDRRCPCCGVPRPYRDYASVGAEQCLVCAGRRAPVRLRAVSVRERAARLAAANQRRTAERDQRLQKYAALRDAGTSPEACADEMGLQPWTRRRYEQRYQTQRQQEAAA